MIASTVHTVILIPVLYVVFRTLAPGRVRRKAEDDLGPEGGEGEAHV
jgi:hypothetical protein